MCIQHPVILTSLCKWKRSKWLFFVVKRYAVREAKKWRYAVRNAKIKRYAVRKGGGGVILIYLTSTFIVHSHKCMYQFIRSRQTLNHLRSTYFMHFRYLIDTSGLMCEIF